jgi:hypothetical protein
VIAGDGLVFALLVYFAPPLIAALLAVHLIARAVCRQRRDRMSR